MKTIKLTFDQPQSLFHAGELKQWVKGDHDVPEDVAKKLIRAGAARASQTKTAKASTSAG